MLFHDEELDEKDLQKFFEKLDSKTIDLIKSSLLSIIDQIQKMYENADWKKSEFDIFTSTNLRFPLQFYRGKNTCKICKNPRHVLNCMLNNHYLLPF